MGLKTAIVDKQWLGGVCLNVGCIPSKALLKNAEVAHTLRERGKEFGFSFENLNLDYGVAVKRSRQVSDRLTRGVGFLMKKNNIDVYMGAARLAAKDTVQVTDKDGKATGSAGQKHHPRHRRIAAVIPGVQGRRRKGPHLLGSHPADKPAQIGGHHRRGRHWGRICHRLDCLRHRSDHGRNAAAHPAAGR